MKIAYFDAASGISGDMTVGALLDAGGRDLDPARMGATLALLDVPGFEIGVEKVDVGGVSAASFQVRILAHEHAHRDWKTIRTIIENAGRRGLGEGIVARSTKTFEALARAEGMVHGVDPERVHFHEVGAVDSIVDIVAAAWCLDELAIEECFVGPLPSGRGYVQSEHGRLPVPAPATVELLRGFEIIAGDGEGEMVTPTGAAILAALAKPMRPVFRLRASGNGAGTRRLADRPNVLRVLVGECDGRADDALAMLEADIDDMTPAALAHVAELLRGAGARDVTLAPIAMKKGRTGLRLTVLSDLADVRRLADLALGESSTIGLRYRACNRLVLARRLEIVDTEFGPIALKIVARPGGGETAEPESDDLVRASTVHARPLAEVHTAALAAWRRNSSR